MNWLNEQSVGDADAIDGLKVRIKEMAANEKPFESEPVASPIPVQTTEQSQRESEANAVNAALQWEKENPGQRPTADDYRRFGMPENMIRWSRRPAKRER